MKNPITAPPPREVTPDGFKVYCAYDEIAEIIGTPETAEEADQYDNTALLKEILGEDTGDE